MHYSGIFTGVVLVKLPLSLYLSTNYIPTDFHFPLLFPSLYFCFIIIMNGNSSTNTILLSFHHHHRHHHPSNLSYFSRETQRMRRKKCREKGRPTTVAAVAGHVCYQVKMCGCLCDCERLDLRGHQHHYHCRTRSSFPNKILKIIIIYKNVQT